MTTIYMAVRYPVNFTGKKDIKTITLEEHLKKYNSTCDNIGDGLQLFLNKEEAEKHLIKVNKEDLNLERFKSLKFKQNGL